MMIDVICGSQAAVTEIDTRAFTPGSNDGLKLWALALIIGASIIGFFVLHICLNMCEMIAR